MVACSKVTLSSLVTITATTYNITVTPVTTTPLVSYPSGGWTKYELSPEVGNIGQGTAICT